jgi:hypothetical protein
LFGIAISNDDLLHKIRIGDRHQTYPVLKDEERIEQSE